MSKKPTATIEDYLGIIYTLQRDEEKVIGARLSEILEVSPPTVTVTLKRMVRDGWIKVDRKKNISLTDAGCTAAKSVIRRHMLTEWLLSKVLNIPLAELHDEAHKIEHTISPQVEEQLANTMQDPEVCPHGNPLPGQESASQDWLPLVQYEKGQTVIFRRIHELLEEDHNMMAFLDENGIEPGISAIIASIDQTREELKIVIAHKTVCLSLKTAEKLYVQAQ